MIVKEGTLGVTEGLGAQPNQSTEKKVKAGWEYFIDNKHWVQPSEDDRPSFWKLRPSSDSIKRLLIHC